MLTPTPPPPVPWILCCHVMNHITALHSRSAPEPQLRPDGRGSTNWAWCKTLPKSSSPYGPSMCIPSRVIPVRGQTGGQCRGISLPTSRLCLQLIGIPWRKHLPRPLSHPASIRMPISLLISSLTRNPQWSSEPDQPVCASELWPSLLQSENAISHPGFSAEWDPVSVHEFGIHPVRKCIASGI